MKNFIEKIKDFLYDATDYVLILVIVVGVVAVIGWRLDILFAKDMDIPSEENKVVITNQDSDKKDENKGMEKDTAATNPDESNKNENSIDDKSQNQQDTTSTESNDNSNNKTTNENVKDTQADAEELITVKIPSGSLPPTIANILLEKGLIENKMEFLIKAQELKLDTKLKSGEFKIKKGIELEELIKLLAK